MKKTSLTFNISRKEQSKLKGEREVFKKWYPKDYLNQKGQVMHFYLREVRCVERFGSPGLKKA